MKLVKGKQKDWNIFKGTRQLRLGKGQQTGRHEK